MKVAQMNWRDVEKAAARDPRCILPIGSTEQHAQLSLCVDLILAEKVSCDAAEPLDVPVFPVMPYGLAPYFNGYPGTVCLQVETLMAVVRDVIASLRRSGFRRILIVNGHGGNNPVGALAQELMAEHEDISIKFHNWWNAPQTWAKAQSFDKTGSHANWMENFPWTRLAHAPAPEGTKPQVDMDLMKASPPEKVRDILADGAFGGPWQRPDAEMQAIWDTGVAETRAALEGPWPDLEGRAMTGKVLIWGAGAIGGILGAYWARAGHDVMMVDIVADHVAACNNGDGLRIEGPVEEFNQVVPCVTPGNLDGTYECIVLAVKAQATEDAVRALLPHLSENGFILSAQNGLNERVIADIAGPERTMGAFVNYGADWVGPGRILFGNRGAVVVGELDGTILPRTRQMHAMLQVFEPDAVLTTDIWAYLWGKLGYGAMLFATALTPDSMTRNFADPARGPALIGLAKEVMQTARAEGVSPKPFNGFAPTAFMPGASDEAASQSIADLADFTARTAKTHTGIFRDLAVRKRKTEVDPQVGAVAEIAASHGIETPLLRRLVELIHDIEDGSREMSADTFHELTKVIA